MLHFLVGTSKPEATVRREESSDGAARTSGVSEVGLGIANAAVLRGGPVDEFRSAVVSLAGLLCTWFPVLSQLSMLDSYSQDHYDHASMIDMSRSNVRGG
jgi:hypothetical protein